MSSADPPCPSICVGIVTYNSAAVVADTLASLDAADSGDLTIEFAVRDNGSQDGTVELLQSLSRKIARLRVVPGGDNIGYGQGHNAIFSTSDCDVYIVCNPDILVGDNFYRGSVEFLRRFPEAGLMSPRMTNRNGKMQRSMRQHPTVLDLALRRFVRHDTRGFVGRRMDRYELAETGYDRPVDVPFCSGALMVCRAEAYRQVGGFDPRYFLYFEDADLGRMMQTAGWRTLYNPEVSVVHAWERAAHTSLYMGGVLLQNGLRYFRKWGWRLW